MGTIEKQGIVLRSENDQTKDPSLRRTLPEDMSSKKWMGNNEISPVKKIASSEEITIFVADSSSLDDGKDECDGKEKPGQFDVWSSILLSKKADDESSKLPLYVHPLVKRSTSALSENSLKICTESLGSETGSEADSFYASSNPEEGKDVHTQQQQSQPESLYFDGEELRDAKYNCSKKVPPKSFPPPLTSLAGCDGPSLHMHSHRENGRLVLEAVSIPSQNYFHAQRKHDRLVLTFSNTLDSKEPNQEGTIEQEEDVIEQVVDEIGEIFETLEVEKDCEEEEEEPNPQAKSLPRLIPSLPAVAASTSFNTYEYFWRAKTTAVNPPNKKSCDRAILSNSTPQAYEKRGMVLLRGNKADYLVPLLRGCKEPRRSLLIWEPSSCIATS